MSKNEPAKQIGLDDVFRHIAPTTPIAPTEGQVQTAEEAVNPGSDEQHRQGRPRGRTISVKRMSKRALAVLRNEYPPGPSGRPATRAECLQGENAERPCPFVSCKHHLYLDVSPRSGAIKLNFPHLEVWDLPETCSLDVADRGGVTLEDAGVLMNLTRERVRQLETKGLEKIREAAEFADTFDGHLPEVQAPRGKGRPREKGANLPSRTYGPCAGGCGRSIRTGKDGKEGLCRACRGTTSTP
jgi:hypothetical protein